MRGGFVLVGDTRSMRIRETTADDLDLVTRMRIEFLVERTDAAGDLVAELTEPIRAFFAANETWTWVAEDDDGSCAGLVTAVLNAVPPRPGELRTREAYLINVFVVPEHRRTGVARRVMDVAIAACEERGIRQLVLHATEDGRPLYEGLGFADPGTWMERKLPSSAGER